MTAGNDTADEPVTVSLSRRQAAIGGAAAILLAAAVVLPGTGVTGFFSGDTSTDASSTRQGSDLASTPSGDSTDTQTGDGSDGGSSPDDGLFGESNASVASAGTTHEHVAFVVAVNGRRIDFSRRQFQLRSRKVHFENGNGTLIHKHADGVTIDYTLNTLGMDLAGDCLRLGDQYTYCEDGGTLNVTANGEPVPRWYEIRDGDTVVVAFTSG